MQQKAIRTGPDERTCWTAVREIDSHQQGRWSTSRQIIFHPTLPRTNNMKFTIVTRTYMHAFRVTRVYVLGGCSFTDYIHVCIQKAIITDH